MKSDDANMDRIGSISKRTAKEAKKIEKKTKVSRTDVTIVPFNLKSEANVTSSFKLRDICLVSLFLLIESVLCEFNRPRDKLSSLQCSS